ncbi:MAG: histidine kinase [Flavobacteriaceae bacterium]
MKNKDLLINILIGLTLLSIPILTSPDFGSDVSLFKIGGFKRNFMGYVLLLLFFYLNYYYFIPHFYAQKKWWAYGAIMLLCFSAITYLPSLLVDKGPSNWVVPEGPPRGGVPMDGNRPYFDIFQFRDTFIFQYLMVLVLSLLLKLEHRLKAIKNEKLKSEVSYLKAQINPHFLFNSLNSIYALTLKKSDKAPQAVLKLSDMMRYVVSESDTENVPLEKEIKYISDYVALQQLRMAKNVDFIFDVKGNAVGKEIAPIILINYVENAFKFGVNPDTPSKIHIFITVDEKGVLLEVENKITVDKNALPPNTEEGIKNTKKRLDYKYPGKYTLDVTETKKTIALNYI